MGSEYALVHLIYTIPPALVLSFLYRPLCTRLDVYKIVFLVTIAVVSTIPWDSYLIRTRIWTYPPNVILGPTFCDIPLEELFFFVIQTLNTSLLYLFLNKATLHSAYLCADNRWRGFRIIGQLAFLAAVLKSSAVISEGGEALYMALIFIWATPFLLLLWTVAHQLILELPLTSTVVPIAIPTVYLWIVDTLALRRGTWVIENGTKLDYELWEGLEIEEAVFFLATNTLIVFGLIAFDNALAVLQTFPGLFPRIPKWPSPWLLVKALLMSTSRYDTERIHGLQDAVKRLSKKSRSFYLASGAFEGRTRIDLVLLYSFCRVSDDLVDEAKTVEIAAAWVSKLRQFLEIAYSEPAGIMERRQFIDQNFPETARTALHLLPTAYLDSEPLYELLKGFEMDLCFSNNRAGPKEFPIQDDKDLLDYGMRVAGTVAVLCLNVVFFHHGAGSGDKNLMLKAGTQMGIALQLVNIARDISADARIGRVYIPTAWLKQEGLSPEAILKNPEGMRIGILRQRMLDRAFLLYEQSVQWIERLPIEDRAPMRVAVESYMEIGRVLRGNTGFRVKTGKATVPEPRRIWVAWKALSRGHY